MTPTVEMYPVFFVTDFFFLKSEYLVFWSVSYLDITYCIGTFRMKTNVRAESQGQRSASASVRVSILLFDEYER